MLRDAWRDGKVALAFLTRLPVGATPASTEAGLAASGPWWPVAGAVIGALGALAYGLAIWIGLPPWPAALLALAAMVLTTGALHEDGLADCADGFGGGRTRAAKLDIMRDSRLGSHGAIALVLALLARASALVALAEPAAVALVLIAGGAVSRALLPLVMVVLPPARADGLAVWAGRPEPGRALAALTIGLLLVPVLLPLLVAGGGLLGAALGALLVVTIARRQIGGHTGDVLGAVQQLAEVGFLLGVLATWRVEE